MAGGLHAREPLAAVQIVSLARVLGLARVHHLADRRDPLISTSRHLLAPFERSDAEGGGLPGRVLLSKGAARLAAALR